MSVLTGLTRGLAVSAGFAVGSVTIHKQMPDVDGNFAGAWPQSEEQKEDH